MMRRCAYGLAVVALLLLGGECFAGRGDKAGTAGAPELLIPVGARAIGLGCSPLASISGIEALSWNPAGLARSEAQTDVLLSHTEWLADIGVEYGAVGFSLGGVGRLGISVQALSAGSISVTTEDAPDGNGTMISPSFVTAGLVFARAISDRIMVGIGSKLIYERLGDVSATAFAFDAGVQYQGLGGIDGLGVGVALKNIGQRIRFGGSGLLRPAKVTDASNDQSFVMVEAAAADLPSTIEIGLCYAAAPREHDVMTFSATFQNNNYSDDEYKFGLEYIYSGMLSFRGGYAFSSGSAGEEYIFGPSLGMGFRQTVSGMDVRIDYAWRSVSYFSGNHVISLVLGI
jgi:hypothetical protein